MDIQTRAIAVSRKLSPSCDAHLRALVVARQVSLRDITAATGISFTTLSSYAAGEATKATSVVPLNKKGTNKGRPPKPQWVKRAYQTHITLAQAEALAHFFGFDLQLVKR